MNNFFNPYNSNPQTTNAAQPVNQSPFQQVLGKIATGKYPIYITKQNGNRVRTPSTTDYDYILFPTFPLGSELDSAPMSVEIKSVGAFKGISTGAGEIAVFETNNVEA